MILVRVLRLEFIFGWGRTSYSVLIYKKSLSYLKVWQRFFDNSARSFIVLDCDVVVISHGLCLELRVSWHFLTFSMFKLVPVGFVFILG